MKEQGIDKRGQRIHTSKVLTKNAQTCNIRNTKQVNEKLGKRADYNIGDCDHTCIIHLEVGKQVMNHSLVRKQDQATYEHALSNTCWTRK